MSVIRKIQCNVPDCPGVAEEAAPNAGWPGWGVLQGKMNDETGEADFHLCPTHLARVFNYLLEGK